MEELGVRVLNVEPETFVMMPAQNVAANIYTLLECPTPIDPTWELEFSPGNLVTSIELETAHGQPSFAAKRLYR